MYIIFTKVWPTSIINTIYKQISSILDNYTELSYSTNKNDMLDLVSSVNEAITIKRQHRLTYLRKRR